MKSFSQYIIESRGIFHSAQIGKQIISGSTLYDVVETGVIDDWDSFQKGKKIVTPNSKSIPKYYTKVINNKEEIYLCGGSQSTSPSKFPGFGWPTASKTKTIKMKPQDFKGITDKWYKVSQLKSVLFKAIDVRSDISEESKEYFKSLYDHYVNGAEVKNYESISSNSNAILRDYGEIVGTIWYLANNSALSSGKVFLPHAGNYPLIDSIIKVNDTEIKVSSKSGKGVSNTVKGKDIVSIISELPKKEQSDIKRKYASELGILQAIENDNTVVGSIKAFNILEPGLYRKFKKDIDDMIKIKGFKKFIDAPVNQSLIDALRVMVPFNEKRSTGNINSKAGVLSLMSKHIELVSKTMKFRELADDVLNGRVIYIHADSIDKKGIITFHATNEDTKIANAYLRYKGSINRASDKLGLQLKV